MNNIVVLGAGVAAAPLIRQTMRNFVLQDKDYKMTVVAPNTHFHWPIAMPRVIVPGQLADDKAMIDFRPFFDEYPKEQFEFVLGTASGMDPASNTVTVDASEGGSRTISYHTLVVATGSSSPDMPWKTMASTEHTKQRLRELQQQIESAKTIVVVGAGATGTETAAELGFEYSQTGKKDVYLVYNDKLPLGSSTIDCVRKAAKNELEKLKVKLVPNTTVSHTERSGEDTILTLTNHDGTTETLTTQAYIPSTGLVPNTSFVPASLLDGRGLIKQTKALQAEGFDNIFVLGDAGNLEASKAAAASAQTVHLVKALPIHLKGGAMPVYSPGTMEVSVVTLGRSRGTGQLGWFKMPSFLVYYAKGRYLGTDYAHLIAAGKKTMMSTIEK